MHMAKTIIDMHFNGYNIGDFERKKMIN